jgi:hypothetical protein
VAYGDATNVAKERMLASTRHEAVRDGNKTHRKDLWD